MLKQAGAAAGALRDARAQAKERLRSLALSGPSATQRYGRAAAGAIAALLPGEHERRRSHGAGAPASSAPARSALGVGDVVGVDDAPEREPRRTRTAATTPMARNATDRAAKGATSAGTRSPTARTGRT